MKKFLILLFFLLISLPQFSDGQLSKLNGIDIWWEEHGIKDNPPVLMIMGLNANSQRWPSELIDGLVQNDFYVLTYDNRDTGKSSWPTEESLVVAFIKLMPNFVHEFVVEGLFDQMFDIEGKFNMTEVPSEYNLNDMALDGLALLDHLEIEKAHIVGASLGGMIGQIIALDHEERAISFTGIMTTPGFDTTGLSGPSKVYIEAMKKSFILTLQDKHQEAYEVVNLPLLGSKYDSKEYLLSILKLTEQHGNNSNSGHMTAVGASPNRMNRLNEISIPTLVIHGSEDPLIPLDHGIAIANEIRNSTIYIMEGVGHNFPKEEIPEIIIKLTDHFNQ